jgi:CTP synthase (UTP-ammonia lyase)
MKRIALVGDYNESVTAHRAIPIALKLAVDSLNADVSWEWIHSRTLGANASEGLADFAAIWCVPASPYENTRGVIDAIRFARERSRPFLGTCGGFQHAMLEYAESVWHIDAVHAELDPNASNPVIAPLMCALVEVTESLRFVPGSRLAKFYGSETASEEYHCSYGLNPDYAERLKSGPLRITAHDEQGGVRGVELDDHPFYLGTLFQPERSALRDRLPPIVKAFVQAVAAQ